MYLYSRIRTDEDFFQIRNQGGQCIPVRVDHENSDEVEALFQRIAKEQDGRLDILVNNAYKGVEVLKKILYRNLIPSWFFLQSILAAGGKTFWELEPSVFDDINNVGLR